MLSRNISPHARQECSIYGYEEYFRGSIPGMSQPVTVAAYTVEGCGGGNNWARFVSAFYLSDGGVREFGHSAAGIPGPDIGDRRGVTVRGRPYDRAIQRLCAARSAMLSQPAQDGCVQAREWGNYPWPMRSAGADCTAGSANLAIACTERAVAARPAAIVLDNPPYRSRERIRRARFLCQSRSRSACRLSALRLPWARPSSTLARPRSLK